MFIATFSCFVTTVYVFIRHTVAHMHVCKAQRKLLKNTFDYHFSLTAKQCLELIRWNLQVLVNVQ